MESQKAQALSTSLEGRSREADAHIPPPSSDPQDPMVFIREMLQPREHFN